jgi:hypothetical protein
LCSCLLVRAAGAAEVRDEARGFRFQLPAEYREYPEARSAQFPYSFIRGQAGQPGFAILLVELMRGTIGREPLVRPLAEQAARDKVKGTGTTFTAFDYRTVKWRDFELELVATHGAARDGQRFVILSTQVPLAKGAIQLMVTGTDQAVLNAELQGVLASLEGTSNWLTPSERIKKAIPAAVLLGGLVVALVVGLSRRRAR